MIDVKKLKALWVPARERCGVILVGGDIRELPNTHDNPSNEFSMDLAAAGLKNEDIIASWHTHGHGHANLSVEDYVSFQARPGWEHYIVGSEEVRRYVVDGTKVYVYDDETDSF